jgi:hypothetical protein
MHEKTEEYGTWIGTSPGGQRSARGSLRRTNLVRVHTDVMQVDDREAT